MYKDGLLKGRRILVTGRPTAPVLGKAMAGRFLGLGAELHICGRPKERLRRYPRPELMKAHRRQRGRVMGVDIRDAAAVDAMVETIFAAAPLTDLINNAAGNFISRTRRSVAARFLCDAVANIVMHGTFYVTHAVGRRWIAAKQRRQRGLHRRDVVCATAGPVRGAVRP